MGSQAPTAVGTGVHMACRPVGMVGMQLKRPHTQLHTPHHHSEAAIPVMEGSLSECSPGRCAERRVWDKVREAPINTSAGTSALEMTS